MPLKPCPRCPRAIPHDATSCPECGWSRDGAQPVATATLLAPTAPAPTAVAPRAEQSEAPFPLWPVAVHKLAILSFCTFGIYQMYWLYKNWQRLRERGREDVSPFWRAFFGPLFGFALFDRIAGEARRRHFPVTWNGTALGLAFLVLSATWRLPDPWWLISLGSVLPLLPVARTVAELNRVRRTPEEPNATFSGGNIATVVVGGLFMLLVLYGTFFVPEAAEGA